MRWDLQSADLPRLLGVGLAAIVTFVFIPWVSVKFVAASLGLLILSRLLRSCPVSMGWGMSLCALYGCGFLLNPLCGASYLRLPSLGPISSALFWQLGLLVLGVIWIWLARPGWAFALRSATRPEIGMLSLAACWALLLVGFHWAPWGADIPYAGDEHYHMGSALVFGALGRLILDQAIWPILGFGLAAAWVGTAIRRGKRVRTEGWAIVGLVLLGIAAFAAYPAPQDQPEDLSIRAIRYPALQPWLSAIFASASAETWLRDLAPSFALLRLLPMIGLFWLGWCLLRASSERGLSWSVQVALVAGLLSGPLFLYYGSVLYLEIPMLPLMSWVLLKSRRWILGNADQVSSRSFTLALITLSFLKDTGIIAALLFCTARWVCQAWYWGRSVRRRGGGFSWFPAEIRLAVVVLGPGILYLLLRAIQNPRPYRLHWQNLLQGELYGRSAVELGMQLGWVLVPALWGLWVSCRSRGWPLAWTAAVVSGGIWLFHFLDDPQWIGYSRFHLMLLPSVVILAWKALAGCSATGRKWVPLTGAGMLLLSNLLMSPVERSGARVPWRCSPERWYPYSVSLEQVGKLDPQARVVLANMSSAYATALIRDRLSWRPDSFVQWAPTAEIPSDSLRHALRRAREEKFSFLFWRWDGSAPAVFQESMEGFVLIHRAVSPGGDLWIWRRS